MKAFRFTMKKNGYTINLKAFEDFTDSLIKEINSDQSIIEQAKKLNREYFNAISLALADMEGDDGCYTYWRVKAITRKTPRYSFIKNVVFNGVEYDVQLDYLDWTAELLEIT